MSVLGESCGCSGDCSIWEAEAVGYGFQVIQGHIEMHAVSKGREHKERKGMEKGERGDEEAHSIYTVSLGHFREGFIIV